VPARRLCLCAGPCLGVDVVIVLARRRLTSAVDGAR
jgi:hypothetical protein